MRTLTTTRAEHTSDTARRLVFVSSPPEAPCPVCGFALDCPGEAVRLHGKLAHPACVADSPIAMRGGT